MEMELQQTSLENILKFSKDLNELIEQRANKIVQQQKTDPYQSEKIDLLSLSLSKAQKEFKPIIFDRQNPYLGLGYTELSNILDSVRKPLSDNELSLSQTLKISNDATVTLHTVLRHSSGQWIESRARIVPRKDDIKAFESALNANKRLSILALLNIAVTGDPMDDDAELAMAEARQIMAKGPSTKYDPRQQSMQRIDKTQLDELEYELEEYPDIAETLMDQMGIQSLADLPKSQYKAVIKKAREIVQFRNKGRQIKK